MMRALFYRPSLARYLAARAGAPTAGGALALEHIRPPRLPGPDWLPVRPRLSGICGSDQAMLAGKASLHLASLTSGPFVPGHEVVGEIAAGPRRGERVVVQPALGCAARGIEPSCPECAEGLPALCRNVVDGAISAGLQTGYCRDTGGGWSEGLVAHASQLHPVGDLPDEDAVLVEPLACALHAAAVADPQPGDRVAVIGAGTIGLLAVAALRAHAPGATLLCAAKHPAQEAAARRFGADHACPAGRLASEGTRLTGARRLVGHGGRELLLGGFDQVLDCVGTGAALQTAVALCRPRGRVVMVGMPGALHADLAPAWLRELELRGAYGYGADAFPRALELARRLRPGRLIDRGWPLGSYRRALAEAPRAARAGRPKTVFEVTG